MFGDDSCSSLELHPQEFAVKGHSDEVTSIEISPDGSLIVSGSQDTIVKIWKAETLAEVRCCGVLYCVNRGCCLVPHRAMRGFGVFWRKEESHLLEHECWRIVRLHVLSCETSSAR